MTTATPALAAVRALAPHELATRNVARTLAAHGVAATVADTVAGPSTRTLVIDLAAGTRPEELDRLARSLAVALQVDAVRVTTHHGRLALEIPRADRQAVHLADLTPPRDAPALSWPIGAATNGAPVLADLARAPHLLISGTTGSGKSTAVGALLSTLVTRNRPEALRLLLIDVKRVELSAYRHLPHLAAPIATDVDAAREVLALAVAEMDERYAALESLGARSIEDTTAPFARLVVVIDELADLMLTARKSIEPLIVRLAQLGRAAGIHLVLATQRPSADVLTGLIRANIPARLALTTQSHTDSLVALGQTGAETLTGAGDALWLPSGARQPIRVQVPLPDAPTRPTPPSAMRTPPAPTTLSPAAAPTLPPGTQVEPAAGTHDVVLPPMPTPPPPCEICRCRPAVHGYRVCSSADCHPRTWEQYAPEPSAIDAYVATLSPRRQRAYARRLARRTRKALR